MKNDITELGTVSPTVVHVAASRPYDVVIGRGVFSGAGREIASVAGGKGTAVLVADDAVYTLYGAALLVQLSEVGMKTESFVFPHGEAHKSTETLLSLWHFLADRKITRSDVIVALGGGVTGDLAAFAASTYLRGIRFVAVPTSLLAMVDSSVGGKTAVDLPEGKNLVGSFYQPSRVLCDPDLLDTLPPLYYADGMAEVIKYGMINRKELFIQLEKGMTPEILTEVIAASVADKRDIVEEDEFDTGVRRLLNLGHTAGHGIEKASDFTVPHGHAVAVGMMIVTRAAVRRGLAPAETLTRLEKVLRMYHLPTETGYDAETLYAAALGDKKRMGGTLSVIVPFGIGDARVVDMPIGDFLPFLREGLDV